MASIPASDPESPQVRGSLPRRIAIGFLMLLLGGLALAAPLVAGKSASFVLGLLILGSGLIQTVQAFALRDRRVGNSAFLSGGVSILAGLLLMALPRLVFAALALLLGLTFFLGGLVGILTALRRRDRTDWGWAVIDGFINVLVGVSIASQWPLTGVWSIAIYVGIHILASGWSMMLGSAEIPGVSETEAAGLHPDSRLRLPSHAELAKLRATLNAEEETRWRTDRYWRWMFILTFFAIHVGRMDAEWNLVGLVSPAIAVVGDICFALILVFGILIPLRLAWRALTRPLERRAWQRWLARIDQGPGPGLLYLPVRRWLVGRMRFSLRVNLARRSPTAALGRGLQMGLPLIAILVAMNPIWGFSWYFNTENWATGFWERWVEFRVDTWRQRMVQAIRDEQPPESTFCEVVQEDMAVATDFSFLVIGDPGEGDASQQSLRDQYLFLGQRPDVKFLVIASDVIYPQGAMKDYESKFYLPFKGFTKPIYAVPGNHDWYDALEAFTANFMEPGAARAAIRARVAADGGLTSTTDRHIDELLGEASRLRREYGVKTGKQRSSYFEMHGKQFSLIVVDTGILRTVDDDQFHWLGAALKRAGDNFKMVILGHPLYAAGKYQGEDEGFGRIHRLLREHEVEVVMAGDTHDFEYYKETYESRGQTRSMVHLVNGGGGAYLSIGTALDWPKQPPVPDCAFYPRTDALTEKLDGQTPLWKQPLWFWAKRLNAWPSSPEAMASAFDFNRAPFFQSFMEVRVEGSAKRVRLILHGEYGPLRWRDLQLVGEVMPAGRSENDPVEFTIPLTREAATR